jgi:hypothetical protein
VLSCLRVGGIAGTVGACGATSSNETKKKATGTKTTYIDGDMAHDASMVWQANILVLVVNALGLDRTTRPGLVVDDKGALDIDLDGAGVGNGLLNPWTLATDIRLRRNL